MVKQPIKRPTLAEKLGAKARAKAKPKTPQPKTQTEIVRELDNAQNCLVQIERDLDSLRSRITELVNSLIIGGVVSEQPLPPSEEIPF